MNLALVNTVNVAGVDLHLRYSNRALANYLNRAKEDANSYDAQVTYFYDLCKNGAKFKRIEFPYSLDEFIELIDPDPLAVAILSRAAANLFGEDGAEKKQMESSV